jgi:chromodomain-helicase-DNA-binding protein 4
LHQIEPKTAEEVCAQFGLQNVELEYDEEDFTTLINYKIFSQHIRGFIMDQNPNIPMSKCIQLVGAKWREFQALNPRNKEKTPRRPKAAATPDTPATTTDAGETADDATPQTTAKGKPKRRAAAKKAAAATAGDEEKTVAPLKIKISNKKKKKKKNSVSAFINVEIEYACLSVLLQDDEEEHTGYNTSDEEFERQLEEAALIQEQEKVEKAKRPKMKKGRGRNARKKAKKPMGDGDDEVWHLGKMFRLT